MQLEDELTLRGAEIKNLRAQLGGGGDSGSQPAGGGGDGDAAAPPGSDGQRDAPLLSEQRYRESGELRDKYETALAASQQEVDSLKAVVDKQNQEIGDARQRVQQANKENLEMMDTWKVSKFIHSF